MSTRHSFTKRLNKRFAAAIFGSVFFASLGISLFTFIVPLFSLDERVSGAWLGSVFAGYFLARLIVAPLVGQIADRHGPRLPLMVAMGCGAILPLGYHLWPELFYLYTLQFSLGLVAGSLKPISQAALAALVSSDSEGKYFGWHGAVVSMAMIFGPLLGGFFYQDRGLGAICSGLALCMAVSFILVMAWYPSQPLSISLTNSETNSGNSHSPSVLPLFMAVFGRTLGVGVVLAFYPMLLALEVTRDSLKAGGLFVVPAVATCILMPVMGRIVPVHFRERATIYGLLISALGLLGIANASTIIAFVGAGCLLGCGAALSLPSAMSLIARLGRKKGWHFGVANSVAGAGLLIGPLLGGIMIQADHAVSSAFQVVAFVGAIFTIPLVVQVVNERTAWGRNASNVAIVVSLIGLVVYMGSIFMPSMLLEVKDKPLYQYTDVAMGTVVRFSLVADSKGMADRAVERAMLTIRSLQQDFNHRNRSGSIGRVNAGAGQYDVEVSDDVFELVRRTLEYSEKTAGAFDVTIGAVSTIPLYYMLLDKTVENKEHLVDYRLIELDRIERSLHLPIQGMALDLGGVAKGAIIDAAVGALRENKIMAGMVEAGGDFYCFGDRDWSIGLKHPRGDALLGYVLVRNSGVCGSGDYQQYAANGSDPVADRDHHILDPATLKSADKSIGVTVIAQTAELSDALATALLVMGPNEGRAMLETQYPKVQALWVLSDGKVIITDGFPLRENEAKEQ